MLIQVLVSLIRRSRRLNRRLTRAFYDRIGRIPADTWTFMDYGFAPLEADAEPLRLASEEEAERLPAQLYDRVASAIPLRGLDVLDVGCGRGGGAGFLMRHHRPASLTGLDASRPSIAVCARTHVAPGLSFIAGEAERLPFAASTFDVVISIEASHIFASVDRFLAEAHRVLRSAGHLLLADFRRRDEIEATRERMEAAGFSVRRLDLITANVVRALDLDSARRQALVDRTAHPVLRRYARVWAGVPGTRIYDALKNGSLQYMSLVAQKRTP